MVVFLYLTSGAVSAYEVSLVKITNEEEKIVSFMYVEVDDRNEITKFGKRDYLGTELLNSKQYPTEINDIGIILKRKSGRDIVILRGMNVGTIYGGDLEIDYLYNGITGRRKSYDLSLILENDSWKLQVGESIVHHLHMKSNRRRFVGTVGIKYIEIVK